MLNITKGLQAKAVTLFSMTIDSPTERVNSDGDAIRPTIYFDNPIDKDGKKVAGKKSTIYTPDRDEAAKLGATQDGCECLCLDGAGKYSPDADNHFRFLKSTLTDADLKEIKAIKGMLSANATIKLFKKACKKLTGQYIGTLPKESKVLIANAIAGIVSPTLDILQNGATDADEDEALF
jgi:hypothetical protein